MEFPLETTHSIENDKSSLLNQSVYGLEEVANRLKNNE